VREGDEAVHRADDADVRITVSWKAEIYADEADRRRMLDHSDDIDLDHVVDTLLADMRARGVEVERPTDPHHDEAWVTAVSSTYGRRPPQVA
jgi:predicted metal-dependent phosphotriesterase family hydrolase